MADKKIVELTAIATQSATDLSETSLNGAGSRKETRLQKDAYTKNYISSKQIASIVISNILASDIVGGEAKLFPTISPPLRTFTFPTKALLYAAMGSPPVNSSINCQFVNTRDFSLTLANSNFDITGLTSSTMGGNSTFNLTFVVTQVTPSLEMSVLGGFLSGNVVGPLIATDNAIATFDGTSGQLIKNSLANIDEFGNINTLPFLYSIGMKITFIDVFDLSIAIGACRDWSNKYGIIFDNAVGINTFTTGAGGVDTGSLAFSSLYYIKVIHDTAGVQPDSTILSLQSGAPTYPAGYDDYSNRGTIQTNGFSQLIDTSLIDFYFPSGGLPVNDPTFTGTLSSLDGYFSWNGTTYVLVAGEGAHETSGSGHILLGKGATTIFNNCFVFCDGTNSTAGDYFPGAGNQACFWASGGFGIGVKPSGGGTQGPQAGFHYGHYAGNDGKNIISGAGPVDTALMVANEINFYTDSGTAQLKIAYKSNAGDVNNIYFPTGDHLMAKTDDTVLTGLTSTELLSSQYIFISNSAFFPATETAYSTTSTIASADLIQKTIVCAAVGDITLTLPTGTLFNAGFGVASPATNSALESITIANVSVAGTVTIVAGTDFTIIGGGSFVIPPASNKGCKIRKSTTAPAFILYPYS